MPQAPRGVGTGEWGGGTPSPLCLLPRKFFIFLLKIPYFDTFWHVYFLNHMPMGAVLTPLAPSSVCHCVHVMN